LLWRNTLKIWDRLYFSEPIPLGCVFAIETIDPILSSTLLAQDRFLGTLDDEIPTTVHGTLTCILMVDVFILRQDAIRRAKNRYWIAHIDRFPEVAFAIATGQLFSGVEKC
jgi:hypothetical protein